ncbi:MAG: DAK2 domain-containing protein [Christensenellales bacterium]
MQQTILDGALLRSMVFTASDLIEQNKAQIDSLNVFPVPDGDTGTNMSLTMQSVVKELTLADVSDMGSVSSAISMGALKGARGNSGVILSQLFRGFAKIIGNNAQVDVKLFAAALQGGVEAAYKAVMKPKEGTMLTVSRYTADAASESAEQTKDFDKLFEVILESGRDILAKTPDMLPVLKQAGVVDAGGMGLLVIYEGFLKALRGEEVEVGERFEMGAHASEAPLFENDLENITYTYCTEFLVIRLVSQDVDGLLSGLRDKLEEIGDSIVVAGDDSGIIKVHVHTDTPGVALQYALELGELTGLKIENMREQNRELKKARELEKKPVALVTVSVGDGINTVFKELMVDDIIEGGQSMNPSTEDIARAIDRAPSDNVIVLPNNKNIILSAKQAAEISDKHVVVIDTKSIPQGIAAAMAYNPEISVDDNGERMNGAIDLVHTVQVTTAVRDSAINGHDIKAGDIIAMYDGEITLSGKNSADVTVEVMKDAVKEIEEALVTLFYGEDVNEKDAEELASRIAEECEDCDVTVQYGGQPLYDYIISIE